MNKEEKLKLFAENLRKARENAGLSKPETASKLNIQPAQYYRYEAGSAEPGIFIAIEMGKLFGITTTKLFTGIESDLSKADYIVNKLREYGVDANIIEGDCEHIQIQFRDYPTSKESISFIEAVISVAEETTRLTMKNAFPAAFFKVLFESVDKDAIDKHLLEAFAKIKGIPAESSKRTSIVKIRKPKPKKED